MNHFRYTWQRNTDECVRCRNPYKEDEECEAKPGIILFCNEENWALCIVALKEGKAMQLQNVPLVAVRHISMPEDL